MPRKIPLLEDPENSDYPSYPGVSRNDMEAVYMPSITSTEKPVNLFGVLVFSPRNQNILVTTQVVRFRVQRFTVNLYLAGFSSCFQSDIACFLDFVCQSVWHVKKSDEQGICLKNRAPPSSL